MASDDSDRLLRLSLRAGAEQRRFAALLRVAENHLKALSAEEANLRQSRALPVLFIVLLAPLTLGTWFFGNPSAMAFGWFLALAVLWALVLTDRRQHVERHYTSLAESLVAAGFDVRWSDPSGNSLGACRSVSVGPAPASLDDHALRELWR